MCLLRRFSIISHHHHHRRQTDTLIFSVWARHTDVAGPALAAVSGTHRLQAGCAHLSMPARSGATVSLWSHPERRHFQPPPSPVVVFPAASDPTYTRLSTVGDRVFPVQLEAASGVEQSATRRHLSSNAHCFSEPPQDLPFPDHFPHNCCLHLYHVSKCSHL